MKIEKINVYLLEKALSSTMRISRGGFKVRRHAIVEIITDDGVVGVGEGVGDAIRIKSALDNHICQKLIGLDPFNIHNVKTNILGSDVYYEGMGTILSAMSAVEMACWDIKGKALNLPIHTLLGGKEFNELNMYASDIYWESDPVKMANNAMRICESGFNSIKIHVGVEDPKSEEIRIREIRKTIGDNINLMIDLNAGYSLIESIEAYNRWSQYNLYWIEEPLSPENCHALNMLSPHVSCAIAVGENITGLNSFKNTLDTNTIDILMPDIGRVGGIEETCKVFDLASAYGCSVSPHNYSSGIILAATIQVMASRNNSHFLEYDTSKNAVYEELMGDALMFDNGILTVPDEPGLGVNLTSEIINKYQAII